MKSNETIFEYFQTRIPDDWFSGALDVVADDDEILVVGEVRDKAKGDTSPLTRFRETTREKRMEIASDAEELFRRKVSWGASVDGKRHLFTHLAIPVMTRLKVTERAVLDTLVRANVARSRSDALAWCVRLVEKHESEWLDELRDALSHVDKAASNGPGDGA